MSGSPRLGTLVERTTGFMMLLHLPQGHGADAVATAMTQAMSRLPQTLRKTLTWDHNENTNGLLRQYFPKGTDLSPYAADYLEHVARKLNNRPRKRLSWKNPAETLDELLSTGFNTTGVALTDRIHPA